MSKIEDINYLFNLLDSSHEDDFKEFDDILSKNPLYCSVKKNGLTLLMKAIQKLKTQESFTHIEKILSVELNVDALCDIERETALQKAEKLKISPAKLEKLKDLINTCRLKYRSSDDSLKYIKELVALNEELKKENKELKEINVKLGERLAPLERTLEERSFLIAFGEYLRAECYVAYAIVNGGVELKESIYSKASNWSALMFKFLDDIDPGLKTSLSYTDASFIVPALLKAIDFYVRYKEKQKKEEIVQAFFPCRSRIVDYNTIEMISNHVLKRYRTQINKLSCVKNTRGPVVDESSGTFIFARCAVMRIIDYIMNGNDKYGRNSDNAKIKIDAFQRAKFALYRGTDKYAEEEDLIDHPIDDAKKLTSNIILNHTGLKIGDHKYIPSNDTKTIELIEERYGYIVSDAMEKTRRGFKLHTQCNPNQGIFHNDTLLEREEPDDSDEIVPETCCGKILCCFRC
jgi:hypothetical protein